MDTMYDEASARIIEDTLIQKYNMSRLFAISDITEGAMVKVVFNGAVSESYPVQGTAAIVRIINDASGNSLNNINIEKALYTEV